MTGLDRDVAVLLDKLAITELLTGYLRAIDRGDIATLRASYLPGATEEHGGLYSGPAQGYLDTIEAALTHPRAVGTHTLSNVLIDVDGIARRRLRFDWSHDLGPRPQRWLAGTRDPAELLHGAKFPADPVYDESWRVMS